MKPYPRFRRAVRLGLLPLALLTLHAAHAGSATWNLNPTSGDWNTAANWTPATVPNGPVDVASFGISNTTAISLSVPNEVNGLVFNPGASPFTFTVGVTAFVELTISGVGITNNSGATQTFIAPVDVSGPKGDIRFTGSATAGSGTVFINQGGRNGGQPGNTFFDDNSSADHGTYNCEGGTNGFGGGVVFRDNATAGNGTFILGGGASRHGFGGLVQFSDASSAGDATFSVNGSDVSINGGGQLNFFGPGTPTAGNAHLIANGGSETGGRILFTIGSSGGTAQIEVFGNGTLTVNPGFTLTIGSLSGDGIALLSGSLVIGSNSLSTTFSGSMQGAGSVTKIGNGALVLSGSSTYIGGTTVNVGTLQVSNSAGSATGTGAVAVNGGTLGGSGTIGGAVTINSGAFLAPATGTKVKSTLTIQSGLTFNSGATYTYTFKAKGRKAMTDKVIANGVTINSGASFNLGGMTQGTLTQGLILTVISNTSATPIAGTFGNLADGAIVIVNGNNLQASYTGGDGNDLTLTVVP